MRPVYRLVSDFIIPNLEKGTYGEHLLWEDRPNGVFKISRIHQSSELWNDNCIDVYKAWSMKKKLWNASDKKKVTRAKHRLITALRRNPEIETLKKESMFYRFRVVQDTADEKKSPQDTAASRNQPLKEETENYSSIEETENHLLRSDPMIVKFQPNSVEPNTNFTSKPFSDYENFLHRMMPMLEDFESDVLSLDEKVMEYSDKCCCEVLLDNYLCNQKCIWHGIPP